MLKIWKAHILLCFYSKSLGHKCTSVYVHYFCDFLRLLYSREAAIKSEKLSTKVERSLVITKPKTIYPKITFPHPPLFFLPQHSDSNCNLKKRVNSVTSQADQSPETSIISNSASQCQPGSVPPPAPPPPPSIGGTSKIDQYSRILFPVAFAGFNLVYWVVYLSKDTMEVSRSISEYFLIICSMFT